MIDPAGIDQDAPSPERMLVLLCTYNERASVEEILSRIFAAVPLADVLVVDDNSPDGTGDWLKEHSKVEPRLFVLSRSGKLGLGGAILAGIRWGESQGYSWLVNLDADLSHNPADIPRLMSALLATPDCDVSVASRYLPGGAIVGWPYHRRFISRWLNRVARYALRLPLRDCSGSFRCYRLQTLLDLPLDELRERGYALLEELLFMLKQHGAKFVEVPIQFTDRAVGKSKLTIWEAWHTALTILRLSIK